VAIGAGVLGGFLLRLGRARGGPHNLPPGD
jgi:hypothetical protein